MTVLTEKERDLKEKYDAACDVLDSAIDAFQAFASSSTSTDAEIEGARRRVSDAEESAKLAKNRLEGYKTARQTITLTEPDMYTAAKPSFLKDLFASQVKGDPMATQRLSRHHEYEIQRLAATRGLDAEAFAITTGTLGGIIPPQYLVNLYAKAPRNGRVFVDQCNRDDVLPPEGMTVIIPRLTQGGTAGAQASEGTTVAEQDPTEADLSLNVRTIAGYFPVSRQTLERSSYSEKVLFEDLIARYAQSLDTQALNGAGTSGTLLGLLQTAGISASTASTATVAGVWPKLADCIQQINTAVGGLGYYADKIIMHPRRWGFFEAALDSQNRPLFGINSDASLSVTVVAEGDAAGYGYVGRMHGLPVFIDANIPTNIGAGTNQDAIIVMASRIVHLWEQEEDGRPITLAFEQQAGNALQTQLVAYGYTAFTAGRYPAGAAAINGAGLVPPTF